MVSPVLPTTLHILTLHSRGLCPELDREVEDFEEVSRSVENGEMRKFDSLCSEYQLEQAWKLYHPSHTPAQFELESWQALNRSLLRWKTATCILLLVLSWGLTAVCGLWG